jgi:hypothetical protein
MRRTLVPHALTASLLGGVDDPLGDTEARAVLLAPTLAARARRSSALGKAPPRPRHRARAA